jgi:dihydrofolate synthase/folylpolyglutamate synthase
MSYDSAVAQMYALGHELSQTPTHKFDLAHMRVLLEALGHPEKKTASILIAGTNGKGSTAATLAAILQASGLKTGLYTSPHLVRINERIRVSGEAIADPEFTRTHDQIEQTAQQLVNTERLPWHPSFFEMLTAMAFQYFAGMDLDIAVLEVGMGGRLDATNVVEPLISVITDISLDHQKFLGNSVAEIAREKSGIIRENGVVVTLPQMPDANDVIGHAILDAGARAVNAAPYIPPLVSGQWSVVGDQGARNCYPLDVMGKEIIVESPLAGRHQLRNIALAIAAAAELHNQGYGQITGTTIERGIRETRWPGRFQVMRESHGPEWVFDVAHNPAGAWALRSILSTLYGDRPITLVFGVMRDKAVGEITEILFPIAEHVIATHAENPRAATAHEIGEAASRVSEVVETPDIGTALERARDLSGGNGLIVVTGSIYVVGEAIQRLGVSI